MSKAQPLLFGVPQGSVLGPVLFSLYVAPLEDIIAKHGCQTVIFADDTQLYVTCNSSNSVTSIESCVDEIRGWMRENFLALNDSKTEVIHFKSKFCKSRSHLQSTNVRVGDVSISSSSVVRNLGVLFDCNATMANHVANVCKNASYSLWRISKIRHLLDRKNTEKLVHAFISSRIDYCNSLLFGIPDYQIRKLQVIQNSAARLVCKLSKRDKQHITPILASLHWLPVTLRVQFKLLCIVFKCINLERAPLYLKDLIIVNNHNSRSLRSNAAVTLRRPAPPNTKTYGDRAFIVTAPSLWNALPVFLRLLTDFDKFKSQLKTYLFTNYYCT